jgi:cytochrome c
MKRAFALALALALVLLPLPATAEMRGHGGPVRAIAISPDGKTAVTGSFDTTVIVWDLERETARQVLRFHEGPVSYVTYTHNHAIASASDDGKVIAWHHHPQEPPDEKRLIVWRPGAAAINSVSIRDFGIHGLAAAAVLADGNIILSGPQGPPQAHLPASRPLSIVISATDDVVASTIDQALLWPETGKKVTLPANANTLAAAPDGEIVAGGADGKVYVLTPEGSIRLAVEVQELPVTSLALSVDGKLIAAAGLRGAVTILDRATGKTVSTLVGPGLPVWSLAFHPDGRTLYTGGADRMVRKWDVATGQPSQPANAPRADFPPAVMNERGAQVFRACEACHTVTPDGGNRAGPTLHGVFGRRIGTAKDYAYSAGFAGHGIVWSAETIARLFREGPAAVTPGTKMPEQKVTDEEDLQALVTWLEKVTK